MVQSSHSSRFETVNPDKNDPDQFPDLVSEQLTGNKEPASGVPVERRHDINRRSGVWWAFLYGNFRPRRRFSRREADEHHLLFDWYEPRILYLALGILLLSCTDALFTLTLLDAGATEANAIMASMLEQGVDRFLAIKIGITALSVVMLVIATGRKIFGSISVEHMLQVLCSGYMLLICYEIYMFVYVFELKIFPGHLIPW